MILFILKTLGAISLGYLGWCFLIQARVPKGLSRPIFMRVLLGTAKIFQHYREIKVKLGFGSKVDLIRETVGKNYKNFKHDHMEMRDTTFDGVKVRIYTPKDAAKQDGGHPGLIYFHGGGWIVGDAKLYDKQMSKFVQDLNLVVMNVEYRLAPEVPFPGPFEDCVAATKYFLNHAREHGVNPERVAIGGDSSGGNLAAAVAIKLRDDDFSPRLKLQVLIYPCIQALDYSCPSMIQNCHGPLLRRRDMAWFWSLYITGSGTLMKDIINNSHTPKEIKETLYRTALSHGNLDDRFKYEPYSGPKQGENAVEVWRDWKDKLLNPYLFPVMAKDLKGVPDAFVFTAQYDVLRDEGLLYVKLLRKFDVDVVHNHMDCGFHGMWNFFEDFPEGLELYNDIANFLKTRL